jgi:hypothetical protein
MHFLIELGPDYEAPSGHKVRDKFVELLTADEPYLAPIRQVLYGELEYAHIQHKMSAAVPELQPILAHWESPSANCSHTI